MQYIASISYGKDSLAMLEIIKRNGMPLDRIVHVEIMATDTIHADLPPMVEFKDKADKIIKDRYGIEVERVHAPRTYNDVFYTIRRHRKTKKTKHAGQIHGFPMTRGAWCNDRLKVNMLRKNEKNNTVYIGIASDEPGRIHRLTDRKRSPLVEHNITESECLHICKELDLLSPIYAQSARGGCWFCHNQQIDQLRLLRKRYPCRWAQMLKWDKDSPVSFRADGRTVHDFDKRFQAEDEGLLIANDKTFRWDMLNQELNYRLF